jgi:hypothetical protein
VRKLSHLNGNRNGRELRGIFESREQRDWVEGDVVEVEVVIADERVEVESRDTKEQTIMN